MSLATVVTIFGLINTLLTIVKEVPSVLTEIQSLIAKVEPHVTGPGGDLMMVFNGLKHQALIATPPKV